MPVNLPPSPTAKNFADAWVNQVFRPAVEQLAGQDGRISANEATKLAKLTGSARYGADNITNYFKFTGAKKPTVDGIVDAAWRYAYANAASATGDDGRLSLIDAQSMAKDLQGDFAHLRTLPSKSRPSAPAPAPNADGSSSLSQLHMSSVQSANQQRQS
ncbi:MAG: hypothetical protein QGI45_11590 [Myxococcota bacterium]|nr:hypothetical protein [Myxococcota bacterium]